MDLLINLDMALIAAIICFITGIVLGFYIQVKAANQKDRQDQELQLKHRFSQLIIQDRDTSPEIGAHLRLRRDKADLTRDDIFRETGLSESVIRGIENGTIRYETWRNLCRYARTLRITRIIIELNE